LKIRAGRSSLSKLKQDPDVGGINAQISRKSRRGGTFAIIWGMDILDKLLGGEARVKILRLFLLNPDTTFEAGEVRKKTKITSFQLRREMATLRGIRFVRKVGSGYKLSRSFVLLVPLRELLFSTEPFRDDEIIGRFKGGGNVKLLVVSGLFTQNNDSRIDVLLVGDRLKRSKIEKALKDMESEIGKELAYALFETSEFKYRMEVYDKFVRDILDYPHKVLLDKIGI